MLDRKTPPPFVHTSSFDLIKPEKTTLQNGVDLYVISGGEQEVVKIEVIVKGGRWFETAAGASLFTANLLNKGTQSKSSFDIAQIFDQYGAHIEISPGFDFVSLAVYSLSKYLEPVLDLLMEILSEPQFPEKELEQQKAIYLQNFKINQEKTSYLASRAFREFLFGQNHPYGKEIEEEHVTKLSRANLTEHFTKTYRDHIAIISGRVSTKDRELLYKKIGALQHGEISKPAFPPPQMKRFENKIKKDGSVQSSIRAGKLSISRKDVNYFQAVFTTHILGGYFGSRLMKNIREEKGLTYGIYASINPLQEASYFLIGADVNTENVDVTLEEIAKELKILRTEKISSSELDVAKNHFIGSLQSEITTPFAHADKIKTIVLSSLPHDYYQQMIYAIDAITPEQIISVSEQLLHEDTLSFVAVG